MIAQEFGFTEDCAKGWKNSVHSRLNKILCEFKEQARAHPSDEKCGLNTGTGRFHRSLELEDQFQTFFDPVGENLC